MDLGAATEMMQRPRNFVPMGLAAGLLLVIGLATYMRLTHQGYRDTAEDGQTIVEPASGSELDASPAQFRWPTQDGATGYVVMLRDVSGTLIWRSRKVVSPEVEPPSTVAIQMSKGGAYRWSVEVSSATGDSELGPWSFRLK